MKSVARFSAVVTIMAGLVFAGPAPVQKHGTLVDAVHSILRETQPWVIGFGEYHQQKETKAIPSSLRRFTQQLIPHLAPVLTDLIIETWYTEGQCGQTETEVVKDLQETTQRPEATEDEVVSLILTADSLNIQPHALELACDDYLALKDSSGEVDYHGLMDLIAEKTVSVFKRVSMDRRQERLLTGKGAEKLDRTGLIAVYGGALHNDIDPRPEWEAAAYGPEISNLTKGRYVEVDLLVPEFIGSDQDFRAEDWFPDYRKQVSSDSVLVFRPDRHRFVVILEKTVQ